MKKIVIIGAGAMGSAFTVPCADNSNEVFLVGSFFLARTYVSWPRYICVLANRRICPGQET